VPSANPETSCVLIRGPETLGQTVERLPTTQGCVIQSDRLLFRLLRQIGRQSGPFAEWQDEQSPDGQSGLDAKVGETCKVDRAAVTRGARSSLNRYRLQDEVADLANAVVAEKR
jgi:hypothetical protein